MLTKMRWRFITAAMTAFAIVMTVLVAGINLITYYKTVSSQNEMLDRISEYRSMVRENPYDVHLPISEMSWTPNPGGEFTARFFAVECSSNGDIKVFDSDYISSVDEKTAREYTHAVLEKHNRGGEYLDYRYVIQESEESLTLTFLNIADARASQRSLLITSVIIWAASLLVVFGLVALFSGKVIQPFAKNMQQQQEFVTNAGHELKTPITSISASADILSSEMEKNEWVENIQKQSTRLTKLVNDLVMLSRLGEETPFRESCAFSLSDAVWETAESFQMQMKASNKCYTQSIEDDVSINGDRNSIQKMLSILLDNAVRYSDSEGTIFLRLYKSQKKIHLEISNSCDTTQIKYPERLFERFYRPDEARTSNSGGSGIGLSIAKSIVENHGGKISASFPDSQHIQFQIIL